MYLQQKIENREAIIATIGLGYVGLPLAVAFAEAGFRVIGVDINEERVETINRGQSYIEDIESERIAGLSVSSVSGHDTMLAGRSTDSEQPLTSVKAPAFQLTNRLSATSDFDVLWDADVVIICVPTPLDKTRNPNVSYILAATQEISRRMHRDMLVVLESTTYPGMTKEVVLPLLEAAAVPGVKLSRNGHGPELSSNGKERAGDQRQFTAGKDFFLAFSPERIDPGRGDRSLRDTPKVLGGVTTECTEIARALYSSIIDQVVPVSSPSVAEMTKLLENTFRAVNIGLVNEMAIMCDRLDIDVWEVIEAAATKPFGFMAFYPGPGLGGHCIPVDPEYLAWKMKTLNYDARFIQLAAEINNGMPHYILCKISDALNAAEKPLKNANVLILGVAYKANISDTRESPALDLIRLLHEKEAKVAYHDPYVPQLDAYGLQLTSARLDRRTIEMADCVVIATGHDAYDWQWVADNSQLVIDTRNALDSVASDATPIVKL